MANSDWNANREQWREDRRQWRDERRQWRYNNPDIFFPVALILVGVVWLLVNNNTIPVENVYRLIPLWPVILIAGGLGLILRRVWWPLNGLLWLGVAGAALWLLLNPGLLPKAATPAYKHDTFTEGLANAKSASVNINLSTHRTEINALKDSPNIIEADLYYLGNIEFHNTGSDNRNVQLGEEWVSTGWVRPDLWVLDMDSPWKIGLTPQIPLNLTVNGGTGSVNMDLTGLSLKSLNIDGGTGSKTVKLPSSDNRYSVKLNGGTGSFKVTAADGTPFDLDLNGGTGSLTIDLPSNAPVQVDVRSGGVGGLHLPSDYKKVSGESGKKEGVYQNSAYASADTAIRITLNIGTGSVSIR